MGSAEVLSGSLPVTVEGRVVTLEYAVYKRKVKFAYLRVKGLRVEVVLPARSNVDPLSLISSKKDWLVKALKRQMMVTPVVNGDLFLYAGKYHHFAELQGESLSAFLRRETERYVTSSLMAHQRRLGFSYSSLSFKSSGSWWGLCTPAGGLVFNSQLSALPDDLKEYVILHEVSHLYQRDHSKRFYDRLAALLPDYREREQRLKLYKPMKRA